MNRLRVQLSFFFVLLLGMMPAYAVSAQGTAATPETGLGLAGVLAEFEVDELADPHAEVWFIRGTLEPDGRLPLGVQNGQTVLYVESGTLTVEAEVFVVEGHAHDPEGTAIVAAKWTTEVEVGRSLMVTRDTEATLSNTSDESTTFLMLFIYSAMDEDQSGSQTDEPVGLTQVGLSIGTAEFGPAPGTIVLERVVVEPGASMQNVTLPPPQEGADPGWMGIDLGIIETGSADIGMEQKSFHTITWPPMLPDEFAQPEQVTLTGSAQLETGESYAVYGSVLTLTNTGDEPLTILRVIVTPNRGP